MPEGVYLFDVVAEKHIDPSWVRGVLGISPDRYSRLRLGRVLFTQEEVEAITRAMRETHNIGRHRLFDRNAEVLPPGRQRRRKGTVSKSEQQSEHTDDIAS